MADLARELGISTSTVSRALSNHPRVAPAMRQRVLKLAAQYHYQPNQLAAALRKGHSKLLGIVVPYLDGHFFPSVLHGIEAAASRAGYSVLICQSNEDAGQEQRHLTTLVGAQVAGVLVSLARNTRDYQHFTQLRQRGLPLVFFDRTMEGPNVNAVVLDDRQAGHAATRHLLGQGCRRIAHLAGPPHLSIYHQRYQGYLDALREANLPADESLVLHTDMTAAQATTAMQQLLARAERPDGVVAAGDYAALAAMQEAGRQGLQVPADVAITGFSNETFTAVTVPSITTIDQRCEEMGRAAVHLLLEVITAGSASFVPRKVLLVPELVVRDSSVRHGAVIPGLTQRLASTPGGFRQVAEQLCIA